MKLRKEKELNLNGECYQQQNFTSNNIDVKQKYLNIAIAHCPNFKFSLQFQIQIGAFHIQALQK